MAAKQLPSQLQATATIIVIATALFQQEELNQRGIQQLEIGTQIWVGKLKLWKCCIIMLSVHLVHISMYLWKVALYGIITMHLEPWGGLECLAQRCE